MTQVYLMMALTLYYVDVMWETFYVQKMVVARFVRDMVFRKAFVVTAFFTQHFILLAFWLKVQAEYIVCVFLNAARGPTNRDCL